MLQKVLVLRICQDLLVLLALVGPQHPGGPKQRCWDLLGFGAFAAGGTCVALGGGVQWGHFWEVKPGQNSFWHFVPKRNEEGRNEPGICTQLVESVVLMKLQKRVVAHGQFLLLHLQVHFSFSFVVLLAGCHSPDGPNPIGDFLKLMCTINESQY